MSSPKLKPPYVGDLNDDGKAKFKQKITGSPQNVMDIYHAAICKKNNESGICQLSTLFGLLGQLKERKNRPDYTGDAQDIIDELERKLMSEKKKAQESIEREKKSILLRRTALEDLEKIKGKLRVKIQQHSVDLDNLQIQLKNAKKENAVLKEKTGAQKQYDQANAEQISNLKTAIRDLIDNINKYVESDDKRDKKWDEKYKEVIEKLDKDIEN